MYLYSEGMCYVSMYDVVDIHEDPTFGLFLSGLILILVHG